MIKQYRKKPIVIEAVRWRGNNKKEIDLFVGQELQENPLNYLCIPTLEGNMFAIRGDWIIKGIKSEFYPCKHIIFIETYEEME